MMLLFLLVGEVVLLVLLLLDQAFADGVLVWLVLAVFSLGNAVLAGVAILGRHPNRNAVPPI
ncbi:hypothetical protein [Microbacterium sp. SSM24]|uniref:hypothetical protein n=1 Tax=Microbacterium sp. SSM24 TaxID=2991714 RepID=UPI002225ED95|nr:hypothetical protein [Microbacterium sp. SSM24]MCW3494804.1 hypothetical protein [Microbacterium sp. SSM24]